MYGLRCLVVNFGTHFRASLDLFFPNTWRYSICFCWHEGISNNFMKHFETLVKSSPTFCKYLPYLNTNSIFCQKHRLNLPWGITGVSEFNSTSLVFIFSEKEGTLSEAQQKTLFHHWNHWHSHVFCCNPIQQICINQKSVSGMC